LLGAFWDVLEALTEGIGEASAIQVAFLLAANQPERAKKLSYSVLYMGFIQSLLVTSVLYMGGRYLAVLFTSDPTMQHMTNDAIPLLGLANIAMSFSQVVWSLIGAQGRFRLATSVMFFSRWLVTLPIACVAIFVFFFDLNSIEGCLVVGYSTASCVLTFILMRSDWEGLGRVLQEINYPVEKQELEFYEDEDDSSDGVGFGNPGENSDDSDEEGRSVQKQSRKPRGHVSGLR
jgi:Na+-driven multidrug efflux pump